MKKLSFDIEGKQAVGKAAFANGTLWVHLDGETFAIETGGSARRRGKSGGVKNPREIIAPMPGKIVKIFVKPGEKVTEGQVLVVMEAMKMEYTLKALVSGAVASVNAKPADQVTLGQLLVKLNE